MTTPNISTITASLERSLQNFSLNHHHHQMSGGRRGGRESSSSSSEDVVATSTDHPRNNQILGNSEDTTLELNSHISLPYQWEQCLDLKTGEIYYINWSNGMKAKEDPRTNQKSINADFHSEDEDNEGEEEEEEEEEEEDGSYYSEESSSESSPSSRDPSRGRLLHKETHVLVVAGCKRCLMYFMVPKRVQDCPKCSGHLLHFDRSETSSP